MARATDFYTESEWFRELTAYLEAPEPWGQSGEEFARAHDRFFAASTRIAALPVKSLQGLAVLAGLCTYWNGSACVEGQSYPDCVIADGPEKHGLDEVSVAYLVKAVLDLAGLKLDAEGRVRNL